MLPYRCLLSLSAPHPPAVCKHPARPPHWPTRPHPAMHTTFNLIGADVFIFLESLFML